MKKTVCSLMVIIMLLGIYGISNAQTKKSTKKETVKEELKNDREVSIFGITLGKSLNEIGIKECTIKEVNKYGNFISKKYEKTQENICWEDWPFDTISKPVDFMRLEFDSSTGVFSCGKCIGLQVLYLEKSNQEKLLSTPIYEIQMGFPYEMSDVFLGLVTKKFGKPNRVEKSVLKNKMGAVFDNETYYWNVGKHKLVLRKRYTEVEAGFFTATHYDKWSKESGEFMKKMNDAEKKF